MYAYILCMHMETENIHFKTKELSRIRNKKLTLLNKTLQRNNFGISLGGERRNYLKAELMENEEPSASLLPTHIMRNFKLVPINSTFSPRKAKDLFSLSFLDHI